MTEYEVQRALLSNDPHDQLNIAYHLIVDNRRLAGEGRSYRQYTFNSDQNLLGGKGDFCFSNTSTNLRGLKIEPLGINSVTDIYISLRIIIAQNKETQVITKIKKLNTKKTISVPQIGNKF